MSSAEDHSVGTSLFTALSTRVLVFFAFAMLTVTMTLFAVGLTFYRRVVGPTEPVAEFTAFITPGLISAAVIGTVLAIGWVIFRRSTHMVTDELTSMSETADKLAETRGTTRFDTKSKITEIIRFTRAFNNAYVAEEELVEGLFQLIRDLSHNIRTPLTHIIEHTEDLTDGKISSEEAVGLIKANCQAISSIVKIHADIAVNNSGRDRTPKSTINFSDLLSEVCGIYASVAKSKGVSFSFEKPENSILIEGHLSKLEPLCIHLLDNAVKYTPTGGSITAALSLIPNHSSLRLIVADTGCGISEADKPHIFDLSFRGENTRNEEGEGWGLSIVQSVVRFYNGTIDVVSEIGKGTTFTVTLPLT